MQIGSSPHRIQVLVTGMIVAALVVAASAGAAQTSRHWVLNVGEVPVAVELERSGPISRDWEASSLDLSPGELVEVTTLFGEPLRISRGPDLLVIAASPSFDPSAVRAVAPERRQAASAGLLDLALRGDGTTIELRFTERDGTPVGYLMLSASRPLDISVDPSRLLPATAASRSLRQEVVVRSGRLARPVPPRALASKRRSEIPQPSSLSGSNGSTAFTPPINWCQSFPSTSLTFTVDGGPANTCGELNVERNGTWEFTGNWLCTDGNGDATKGPWYCSGQSGDETAEAFIRWPDDTATSSDWHIWDLTCSTVKIDSGCLGSSPACWSGDASDPSNGACYDSSWALVYSRFYDATAGRYYLSGSYGSTSEAWLYGSFSGLPSCAPSWSTPYPPAGAHTSGHLYVWTVCAWDGQCQVCDSHSFTY